MEIKHGFISADDHLQEHPRVWLDRIPKARWAEEIPQLRDDDAGNQYWSIGSERLELGGVAVAAATMLERSQNPQRWAEVPESIYQATERLKAMDQDGVDYSILYPTVAGASGDAFWKLSDPDLALACVQAYNDWCIEEWASVSPRLVPQCIIPREPIDAVVKEVQRAVALGHRGVIVPAAATVLNGAAHINDSIYEPLWALCQDLDVPVCFHAGSHVSLQFAPYASPSAPLSIALSAMTLPVTSVSLIANFLFSPIAEHFPSLKVIFSESSLAWGPYEIEIADHGYERQRLYLQGRKVKPSEVFRRQCFVSGWCDRAALLLASEIGADNMLWESHFPSATSTWPDSHKIITANFADIAVDDREKILWRNVAQLYSL